jgi:acyl-coenzyme A thioesterase PaaI-like protein
MNPDVAATRALRASTPFAATLGMEVLSADREHALLRLPAAESIANHVGGPHAGAIFTLGESAAATLMVQRFGSWLDRAVPLAVGARISWSKLARSAVSARATAEGVTERVEAELAEGGRPEWETTVVFAREEDGQECARMTVVLTLAPPRPNP